MLLHLVRPHSHKKLYAVQATLKPLDVQETKDIETTVAGIRSDKLREKTASDAAKKGETPLQRASLNTTDLTLNAAPLSLPHLGTV